MDAFVIRSRLVLTSTRTPTPDDISDLIEVLSDGLDERGHEPDISTQIVDGRLEMVLRQHVTARTAVAAQREAVDALGDAFEALHETSRLLFDETESVETLASRELAAA